jgi:hypothetical protein
MKTARLKTARLIWRGIGAIRAADLPVETEAGQHGV